MSFKEKGWDTLSLNSVLIIIDPIEVGLFKTDYLSEEENAGGSAWESNPPERLLTPHTGFEVREGHQCPIHFHKEAKTKNGYYTNRC
jgi:hypothetical protein